jgi:uncharacterized protein
MHGQFVWYELTTPDVEGAKKFYPQLTSWGTQAFDNDYTMFTNGGAPVTGIFKLGPDLVQKGVPPNWMPYIEAGDVDHTAKQAASLGGKIVVPPQDIPGTGRFAVLQDPQGATFGIYKSNAKSQSWDGTAQLGRPSWHELMTTDYAKAFDFYRKLFAWEKLDEMDMGGGNNYSMFGKGKMFGGMFNRMADMAGMHPFWMVYFFVKDVDKAVDTAKKAGAKLHRGPMDIPGGRIAILGDPQGAGFALHAATPVQAAKPAAKPATKTAAKKSSTAAAKRPVATKAAKASKSAKRTATKRTATKRTAAKKKSASRKRTAAPRRPAAKKSMKRATKKTASKKSARRR